MPEPHSHARALRLLLALMAVVVLGISISRLDLYAVAGYLGRLDARAILVLVPFGVARLIDAAAFRWLLSELGSRAPFPSLFAVRLGTEAVSLSVVAGPIVSEGVSPWLLSTRSGVPPASTVAAQAGRKRTVLTTHGIFLILAGVLAAEPINRASAKLVGFEWGNLVVLAAGVMFVGGATLMGAILRNGRIAVRLLSLVRRVPRAGAWLDARAQHFAATDDRLRAVSDLSVLQVIGLSLGYLVVWSMDIVETYVIMTLLGAPIGILDALALETVISVLKGVAFAVPGGLGVQDLGYATLLVAMGAPGGSSLAAAFVVLKRVKELVWISAGYGALAALGFAPRAVVRGAAATKS